MTRTPKILLSLLLVLSIVLPSGVVLGASDSPLEITNVEFSNDAPTAGEPISVEITVKNTGSDAVDLSEVWIRESPTGKEYGQVEDLPRLDPGESTTVPVRVVVDQGGTRSVHVGVRGYVMENVNSGTETETSSSILLQVQEHKQPSVQVDTGEVTANISQEMNVTVLNLEDQPITDVRVTADGDFQLENPTRIRNKITEGASQRFQFQLLARNPGSHELRLTVRYRLAGGTQRNVTVRRTVDVEPLEDDIEVVTKREQSKEQVRLSLFNSGDQKVENVILSVSSDDRSGSGWTFRTIGVGGSKEVVYDAASIERPTTISIRIEYEIGDVTRTIERSIDYVPPSRGPVLNVSNVEINENGNTVEIRGTIGNTGNTRATGVIVSTKSTDRVTPVHPGKSFFVGRIPASDFVTYDLSVRISGEESVEIPVEISYMADNRQYTKTTSISYDPPSTNEESDSSASVIPIAVVVILVTIALAGIAFVGITNARDDNTDEEDCGVPRTDGASHRMDEHETTTPETEARTGLETTGATNQSGKSENSSGRVEPPEVPGEVGITSDVEAKREILNHYRAAKEDMNEGNHKAEKGLEAFENDAYSTAATKYRSAKRSYKAHNVRTEETIETAQEIGAEDVVTELNNALVYGEMLVSAVRHLRQASEELQAGRSANSEENIEQFKQIQARTENTNYPSENDLSEQLGLPND